MKCEKCGEEHDGSYGSGRFCCSSCARSFSSFKKRNEINLKIKKTLHEKYGYNIYYEKKYCNLCGKILRNKNKTGYCRVCLETSNQLKDFRSARSKYASSFIKNHNSWQPRNKISYAEKFWFDVLNNNKIDFKHDFSVKTSSGHWYYLDFYIEKEQHKIDLEIDGKQHNYDYMVEHDKKRNEALLNDGYIVYRIPWNDIKKTEGKLLMKEKIDNFLNFLNSL